MTTLFEELDYCPTELGALILRRRRRTSDGPDIYEIKLGDEFLMTSQFTASEIALAELGLSHLTGDKSSVVVGGLGLGYTAKAALETPHVKSLLVVEFLQPVIDWHNDGLLPLGAELTSDPRCRFVHGDFFEMAASEAGFDPENPGSMFDAILLDIDHSPSFFLDPRNKQFYTAEGLSKLLGKLRPGGAFALWSNEKPDAGFVETLHRVFAPVEAHPVTFPNPLQGVPFTQTVYVGRKP